MSDALVLRIPRPLHSPNVTRGYHWRVRARETRIWEGLISQAVREAQGLDWLLLSVSVRLTKTGRVVPTRTPERRRVTIVRETKSRRRFIRDDDNLRFCVKPVNDALKRIGLLFDDSRTWLEQPMPEQRISIDGQDWTQVTIERVG